MHLFYLKPDKKKKRYNFILLIPKREKEKLLEKEERARLNLLKKQERLAKGSIKPLEMFKNSEYSEWDSMGLPLKDREGIEISKSKRKKLEKEYAAQVKLHQEFLLDSQG